MADDQISFLVELIPDEDSVFMRAYKDRVKDGIAGPSAFKPHGSGLSVDWDRYSTPEDTRSRAKKNPSHNAVVRMVVGEIRNINESLDVRHAPLPENQAHAEVNLPDDNADQSEVRVKLSRLATIVIPVDA